MATYGTNNFGMSPLTSPQGAADYISSLSQYPGVVTGAIPATAPVLPPIATPSPTLLGAPQGVAPQAGMWDSFKSWMNDSGMLGTTAADGTKTQGWGGFALGAAQGLGNAFLGMQQYGLAKDTFNENKRQFNMNFEAQRKTTNAALEDRQRARVASNGSAYQSVGDYMNKYGV